MGKVISDRLGKLKFMANRTAPSAQPSVAEPPAAPTPPSDKAPKVSSKLMGLKFMQRAQNKVELHGRQAEAAKRLAEVRGRGVPLLGRSRNFVQRFLSAHSGVWRAQQPHCRTVLGFVCRPPSPPSRNGVHSSSDTSAKDAHVH